MRAGALGDLLLLRRAVAALRRDGWRPALLAPLAAAAVLRGPGPSEVEAVFDWERSDAALLLEGAPPGDPLASELAGFAAAVVYSRRAEVAAGLKALVPAVLIQDPIPSPGVHAAAWSCRPLAALGVPDAGAAPPMVPSADEERAAAPWLARLPAGFLAVHPGSGSPAKNWPPARYAELVARAAGGRAWLLVEGPADAAAAAPLRGLPGAVHGRDLPLRVLGAVLARAGCYAGNDSGLTHLAAAYGAPTLALFGPTDPAVWSPDGDRVTVIRAPGGALHELTVETVAEAARGLTSAS